jgi:hypothetical protein
LLQVLSAKVKLMALQESLLTLEMDTVEVVATLITEFDRAYSEMAEANKLQYNAYFTQVRCCSRGHLRLQIQRGRASMHSFQGRT